MQKGNTQLYLLFVVLVVIGLAGAFYLGKSTNTQSRLPALVQSSPVPNKSNGSSSGRVLTIEKLSFNIPEGWWDDSHLNDETSRKWFNINPTPLPVPGDAIPAYMLTMEKNKTVELKTRELIEAWGLSEKSEESFSVNNIKGTKLEGLTQSGYLDSKRVKIAIFTDGEDVYYFFDTTLIANHETYFDKILSTFEFTQ